MNDRSQTQATDGGDRPWTPLGSDGLLDIRALIFDFDGTLVDSMPLHYQAYCRVLSDIGLPITQKQFFAATGGNSRETIPKLIAGRPCALSPAEIHALKKAEVARLFAVEPITVLGAGRLLSVLRSRYRVAMASSGSRAGIDQILARLGWSGWFEAIVSGEDTPHGKPAPDLYLLAAKRLGESPARCLAFDDTDPGVESARAAGMSVIDVRSFAAAFSLLLPSEA